MKTAEEFWALVERGPGCWRWTDAVQNTYGRVFWRGRMTYAHRVAFELATGEPAPPRSSGRVVLHSCDNTLCVNPAHLSLGTQAENMRQREERGRGNQWKIAGERSATAKLTEDQVRLVRKLVDEGASQRRVAATLGMTQAAISYIVHGKTWKRTT